MPIYPRMPATRVAGVFLKRGGRVDSREPPRRSAPPPNADPAPPPPPPPPPTYQPPATAAAKKLATEKGIDLQAVPFSGPHITRDDVRAHLKRREG